MDDPERDSCDEWDEEDGSLTPSNHSNCRGIRVSIWAQSVHMGRGSSSSSRSVVRRSRRITLSK